jgi:hypothetical protein
MSTIVEKVTDAVNDVTAALGNTSLSDKPADTDKSTNAAHNEAVLPALQRVADSISEILPMRRPRGSCKPSSRDT